MVTIQFMFISYKSQVYISKKNFLPESYMTTLIIRYILYEPKVEILVLKIVCLYCGVQQSIIYLYLYVFFSLLGPSVLIFLECPTHGLSSLRQNHVIILEAVYANALELVIISIK